MVAGGQTSGEWTDADLHEYRKRAVERLEYACGWPPATAVAETDARYREVTADLDPGSRGVKPDPFSSCAVLPMWLYCALGIREPWIDHPLAPGGWRGDGGIVSRLVEQSVPWAPATKLEGGDVIIIANKWPSGFDAHVVCIIDQPDATTLDTAEYGQPGGALEQRMIQGKRMRAIRADGTLSAGSVVRVVIPLARVLVRAYQRGLLTP